MTSVYFVRHADPDHSVRDDRSRPLTNDGLRDSKAVTWLLADKHIEFIASSTYKRAVDTVADLADTLDLPINVYEDFRERSAGSLRGDNIFEYIKKQWSDFDYHIEDGESLREVQMRNIRALKQVLAQHGGQNIVIATHGTSLSTMLNYYYPEFDFKCFKKIVDFMPFIIRLDFDGEKCVNYQTELIIHKDFNNRKAN